MDRVSALYRDHSQKTARMLRSFGTPDANIEDLLHEVFLVAHRKLSADHAGKINLGTPDQERAWLYRIAYFEAKKYRARARTRRMDRMDTNEVRDPRNEAARLADGEQLLLLLDSITNPQGRELFYLVELEGFAVTLAARTLEITETTARHRLDRARREVAVAAAKLAQEDAKAGKKRSVTFLLPFGTGAWLDLQQLLNPPEGTTERVWQRFQATVRELEQENDSPEDDPTPRKSPVQSRLRRLLGRTRPLPRPLGHLLSAGLGGMITALLFLLRPSPPVAILQIPIPIFVTSAPTAPAPPPGIDPPPPPSASPTEDPRLPAAEPVEEEDRLMRQARAAYAKGYFRAARAALDDYEARYPAGRFKKAAADLRASLPDAGAR